MNLETVDGAEPVWDLARIGALVESHRAGWLFVAGCVANQGAAYGRFDAIVLLSAPVDELLRRVASHPNPFGSTSKDRAKIAHDQSAYEPLLPAGASHEIDTTTSVAHVATTLETIAEAASGS